MSISDVQNLLKTIRAHYSKIPSSNGDDICIADRNEEDFVISQRICFTNELFSHYIMNEVKYLKNNPVPRFIIKKIIKDLCLCFILQ